MIAIAFGRDSGSECFHVACLDSYDTFVLGFFPWFHISPGTLFLAHYDVPGAADLSEESLQVYQQSSHPHQIASSQSLLGIADSSANVAKTCQLGQAAAWTANRERGR